MAKVIFKTFQEAAVFSKSLSMTIKASTFVKRDGDTWFVDDPRSEQVASQTEDPDIATGDEATIPAAHTMQYDEEGYDQKGYDCEGFTREGFDKKGRLRPF